MLSQRRGGKEVCENVGCPVEPSHCGGSTAFATARSCQGCRGFRRSLRSQRNGGGRRREQGEMGGEGKGSSNGTPQPAAHLPLLLPACGPTIPRNATALSGIPLRCAMCDVRLYHRLETKDHRPFSYFVNRTS